MIQLFHAGTEHIVNGITCKWMLVNEFGFEQYLDEGWHFSPEECYPDKAPKTADPQVTDPKEMDKTTTETAVEK